MNRRTRKIAAALAAVNAYLAEEAAAARPAGTPRALPSMWALAGKLDRMRTRLGALARTRSSR